MKKLLLLRAEIVKRALLLSMICGFGTMVRGQQVSESFEGPNFPPQEWNLTALFPAVWPVWKASSGDAAHGSKSAFIENKDGFGADGWLITPKVELLENQVIQITFDYKVLAMLTGGEALPATFKITAGNNNTFDGQTTILETISIVSTSPYTTKTVSFTAPAAGTYYFGFYANSPNHQSFGLLLDKIIIDNAPGCLSPVNLEANDVAPNSANIEWDAAGTAITWQVQITKQALPIEANWVAAPANQYDAAGLTPGTIYTAYVRSVCPDGGYSTFSGPVTFTTTCPEVITAPYAVPFSVNYIPGCWTESGATSWKFNTNAEYDAKAAGDHTTLQGNTYYAWMDGSNNINDEASILISPTVDISGLTNPAIEFYVFSENLKTQIFNEFKAEVYNGTAWQTVAALSTASDGWKFYSVDLNALGIEGTASIRFTVTGNGENFYNDILIDDVSFKEKTICLPAQQISADIITDNSIKLSWTSGIEANSWDIAYGLYNFDFDGTANATSISSPYIIDELEPGKNYHVYIRANCGGGNFGEWTGPYTYMTDCLVIEPDYHEAFNAVTEAPYSYYFPGLPKCWEIALGGDSTTGPLSYGEGTWDPNTNAEYGFFTHSGTVSTYITGTNNTSWLLSPLFDLSAEEYEMKVSIGISPSSPWYGNIVNMGSDDEVKILYSVDNGAWQPLKTWTGEDNLISGLYSYLIPLTGITGSNVRFSFWSNSGSVNDGVLYLFHVNDLVIRKKSLCPEPLNLTADGITDTTAKLGWDNYGDASLWNVAVVFTLATPATEDWVIASGNPFEAEGLLPNTTYDYYVQSNCGGVEGEVISGPFTFTTRCEPIVAPYTETFVEQMVTPECWLINPTRNDQSLFVIDYWYFNTEAGFDAADAGDHTEGGETQYAWINTANFGNKEIAILTTPLVDVSALVNPSISFYLFSKNTISPSVNSVLVEVYTGDEWIVATNITGLTNNWAPYTIDLGNYTITGPVVVRFTVTTNSNGGNPAYNSILIDDVAFIELTDCPAPFNISTTEITEASAIVQWEAVTEPGNWEVEYGPAGFDPGTGTVVIVENGDPSIVLDDLTADTPYDIYVKAVCDDEGELVGPHMFTTDEVLDIDKPFRENITLYPNPVVNTLNIKSAGYINTIVVYNIYGQKIKEQASDANTAAIDFTSLSSGVYLIKVNSEGREKTFKIIKD